MHRNKQFSLVIMSLLILAGCRPRQHVVSKQDLVKYVKDPRHGLVKEIMISGIRTRLSYEPSSLLPAGGGDSGVRYDKNYYFILKFSKDDKEAIRQMGGFSRYSDLVQVLSFQMEQFVNLVTDTQDTIGLSDYAFDQTYGMSDGNSLILSFPRERIDKARSWDIHLAECGFGIGSQHFNFRKEDLDDIPTLDDTNADRHRSGL